MITLLRSHIESATNYQPKTLRSMRKVLLPFLLFPLATIAQKLKVNEYDKYLKQKVIETTTEALKTGVENYAALSLKAVGNTYFVSLKGYGAGATTISMDDPVIFLLDNDSTITAKSIGVQTFEYNQERGNYKHQYAIDLKGLESLSRHKLIGIRKYNFKNYVDIKVPERNQAGVMKISSLLINELAKEKLIYGPTFISLEDVAQHVGDSVTVNGMVYPTKYMVNSDNKPTLLNMGAPYPKQLLTVVIYEEDRSKFPESPESYFKEKELLVSGRIELYNDRPQIIVRKREQVIVKESAAKASAAKASPKTF